MHSSLCLLLLIFVLDTIRSSDKETAGNLYLKCKACDHSMKPIPNVTWRLICCEMPCDTKAFIHLYFDKNKTESFINLFSENGFDLICVQISQIRFEKMETTREEILSSIKGKTTSAKKIPYWWGNECQTSTTPVYVKLWTHPDNMYSFTGCGS